MAGISPKLPLTLSTIEGPYTSLKDLREVVKQNLTMLLLTNPGERIMDPTFGVGLETFLFEQASADVLSDISSKIEEQLNRFMPFVSLTNLYFGDGTDDLKSNLNTVHIQIVYYINPLAEEDVLSINIPENNV
jgi:phage baseplate assembly protein W